MLSNTSNTSNAGLKNSTRASIVGGRRVRRGRGAKNRSREMSQSGPAPEPELPLSLKELTKQKLPTLNTSAHFTAVRQLVQASGGARALHAELCAKGFVDGEDLTTHPLPPGPGKPFNPFTRIAMGLDSQGLAMEAENALLSEQHRAKYRVACNRKQNDDFWASSDTAPSKGFPNGHVGSASMAKRHRFLLVKDLSWETFNVLTFGLGAERRAKEQALAALEDMRDAALSFTRGAAEWSANVGLFFHVYGHNSVNALHLHIVDLDATGPSYVAQAHKNLSLETAMQVLRQEIDFDLRPPCAQTARAGKMTQKPRHSAPRACFRGRTVRKRLRATHQIRQPRKIN